MSKAQIQTLIESGSEVNGIHPTFAKQLGFHIRLTNVGAQKIDGTTLDTYGIVVVAFLVEDEVNQVRCFKKIFLVANVSLEVVLGISFLTLSSVDVDFSGQELRWRSYTTKKMLPTTRRVELMDKKEFAAAALDLKYEIYVIYVTSLSSAPLVVFLNVYPSRRPQISRLITK